MTVLTTTAGPRQDTGAAPRPVPWQGMLWVTWRQHRGLLISVLVTFLVAVAAMLVLGLKLHHDYAILTACRPAASPGCAQLSNFFNTTDWHDGNGIRVGVLAAPVLLAMFAGPPVLAREFENGTFRYAWTQGIGRVRWTVAKLTVLGAVVTIAALVISQLFAWFFAPFLKTQNLSVLTPTVFDTRGVVYAAWTLTALCLGAFLGALIRRILPAMAAALGAYAGLTALTWFWLHNHYPVSTFWPMQVFETGWLLILSALLVAGTVGLVRRHAT
jgi:hypothetical protein